MTESRVHHKMSPKDIVLAVLRWFLIIFFAFAADLAGHLLAEDKL